ncbi:hypothetical protein [Krasilnikovia sp. MM14-A1259]|uniref:hypothetical protein n=1 Tax=Krasilnikovia sp. MM14-A1259 TaxID=3373539 RepID=UPI00399C6B42
MNGNTRSHVRRAIAMAAVLAAAVFGFTTATLGGGSANGAEVKTSVVQPHSLAKKWNSTSACGGPQCISPDLDL